MKLLGFVEVFNHRHNVTMCRSRHSTLSVFKEGDEAVLLLQQPCNKSGLKYKVTGNVLRVFTQFLAQGKLTIRLREPPHELRLQNESVQLMSFIKYLHNCTREVSSLPVLPTNPKFTKRPPTSVVINSTQDYGKLEGLSLSTERLQISSIKISKLPHSISRLKKLNYLEVSDAKLSSLPASIMYLPNLKELVLTNDCLQGPDVYVIIGSPSLRESLRLLDLRDNKLKLTRSRKNVEFDELQSPGQIRVLPDEIHFMRALVTLRLDNNLLCTVPHTLFKLKNLRILSLSNNPIISYPYSIRHLKNVSLDISNNRHCVPVRIFGDKPWDKSIPNEKELIMAQNTDLHTLKELSFRAIFDNRVHFRHAEIPVTLERSIHHSKRCRVCNRACFQEYFYFSECINLTCFMTSLVTTHPCVSMHFYACSRKCMLLVYPKLCCDAKLSLRYVRYSHYLSHEKYICN